METMAAKGEHYVTVEGSTDKRSMTGTFSISFDGNFLPMQPIYGGKTTQSLPRFGFPKDFSLSTNSKHFSNTDESLKFLKEALCNQTKAGPERFCGSESTSHHGRLYSSNDNSCIRSL